MGLSKEKPTPPSRRYATVCSTSALQEIVAGWDVMNTTVLEEVKQLSDRCGFTDINTLTDET
jgi:hypothetical protein